MRDISTGRILKVIEGLTMGELTHEDLNETLGMIYRFSHLASACKNKHESWREEFIEIESRLKKSGII